MQCYNNLCTLWIEAIIILSCFLLQTGSGKTYTMGTGFDMEIDSELIGVIPRAVSQIFTGIEERRREAIERNEPPPQYELTAQFLEVR